MLEVHPIFQTPFFVREVRGLTAQHGLDEFVRRRCAATPGTFAPNEVIQSRYDLNRAPELAPLCAVVFETVRILVTEVYQYSPHYVAEITSMWGNVQRPGTHFRRHIHHNNIFSGVFYLNEDPGFPPITFWRPTDTTIDPEVVGYNAFSQGSFRRTVGKDHLVIFPAWLPHSVDTNNTTTDRLGVSFNVMLRGGYHNTVL